MKIAAVCVSVFLISATAYGQRPEFEVATVKRSVSGPLNAAIDINLGTFRNGTLTMTNVTLTECVQFAYSLVSREQLVGPDWINSRETRFDIVAKTTPDINVDGARRMLQSLLADRLKLVVRIEQRPYSFVAVVPAKGGSKLVPAVAGEPTPGSARAGLIVGRQMPMSVLMSLLARLDGQLFVDKTGLMGRYQIKLEWSPENDPNRNGPSLSEALEQQLGLRMEHRREPLDVVVVEKAEQIPADN